MLLGHFLVAPDGVGRPFILSLNSTALNVSWNEPGRANGIIQSYQLIARIPVSQSSYALRYFQHGLHFSQIVSNLQPYTNYSFKLAVNGSGGRSESQWQNFTTLQDSKRF